MEQSSKNSALQKKLENSSRFYADLYSELYDRLKTYGRTVCKSEPIIEDSIQELFLYFLSDKSRLDHVDNIESYLSISLKRRIIKKVSSRRDTIDISNYTSSILVNSAESKVLLEETERLRTKRLKQAVNSLPKSEAKAITHRFFDGMSYDQIAEINSSTKRTVYNQIHAGVKKLKKILLK